MKKMPTLFKRSYNNGSITSITRLVTKGCEWVINGEGIATQKLDGTCCLIKAGQIYARYDAKKGKKPPEGAISCQPEPDPITGHWPHWILVTNQPQYKWHKEALNRQPLCTDGTYELCGKHFQDDPEHIGEDRLFLHGLITLSSVPRNFDGIFEYLKCNDIEGIVFHRGNGDMCKIKKSDFDLKRDK